MYISGTLLAGRNYQTTAVQLRSLNFFVIINSNQFLAKKADITRGEIIVNEIGKDSPSYSCNVKNQTVNLFDFSVIIVIKYQYIQQISIVIRDLAFGFHLYCALSVKVPFYKSSITFRLLNRDKVSFRPHVFFGVVKVSIPKEVL